MAACLHPLKELNSSHSSSTDIVAQLTGIDPSRLSLSSVLDLVSDSPTSSVGEPPSDEDAQDMVDDPEMVVVDLTGQPKISELQENPGPPEVEEGTTAAIREGVQSVAITMPEETTCLHPVQLRSGSPQASVAQRLLDVPKHHEHHQPFLEVKTADPVSQEGLGDSFPPSCCSRGCSKDRVKAVAFAFVALLVAPWILYGLYRYLPLGAPACPDLASRLAFALRSLLMAGVPVILGIIFRPIAALCRNSLYPLCARAQTVRPYQKVIPPLREQFAVFGLNLLVMATFLPQEHLKLIPILAGLFVISRICYSAAWLLRSPFQGFGFGLAIFPCLLMMAYNLYCLHNMGFGFLFVPAPSGDTQTTAAPMLPAGGN